MKKIVAGLGIIGALAYTSVGAQLLQHGPTIINPGTPDAAIMTYDPARGRSHVVQLEYLALVGRPDVVWFEDGSGEPYVAFASQLARARQARIQTCHAHGLWMWNEDGSCVTDEARQWLQARADMIAAQRAGQAVEDR